MGNQETVRQGTADLAKGVAVLLMIQVHLTEVFAVPTFYSSWLGKISLFCGGPPVAPVFMVILGYFLGKTRRTFSGLMVRGAGLFLIGLLLNIGLNLHLLIKILKGVIPVNPWEYLLGVDILFLAALSIIILAIFRPIFKRYHFAAVFTAVAVTLISPWLTTNLTMETPIHYLLAYIGGNYSWSYFPLFPWFAYPLLGFAFSQYREQFSSRAWNQRSIWIATAAMAAVIAVSFKYAVGISVDLPSYYHHGILFFLWTTLFLGCWFAVLAMLHKFFSNVAAIRYLKWLGRSVLAVYIFQWLIIGNIGTALYRTQELPQLIMWLAVVIITVSALEFFRLKIIAEWTNRAKAAS